MSLLFALAIHDALCDVAAHLLPGEDLCAYLDDVYALCQPARVRPIFNLLQAALRDRAGIDLNLGKTAVSNRAGIQPPDLEDLERKTAALQRGVWSPDGVIILGSLVGSDAFIALFAEARLAKEKLLLDALDSVPDLQRRWQIPTRCAIPRMNHVLRTLPLSRVQPYAAARDQLA